MYMNPGEMVLCSLICAKYRLSLCFDSATLSTPPSSVLGSSIGSLTFTYSHLGISSTILSIIRRKTHHVRD